MPEITNDEILTKVQAMAEKALRDIPVREYRDGDRDATLRDLMDILLCLTGQHALVPDPGPTAVLSNVCRRERKSFEIARGEPP